MMTSQKNNALDLSLREGDDPELGLSMLFTRVTEAAALASSKWLGLGDKEGADGAAVVAMRRSFEQIPVNAKVIIGEGEKDNAPMLFQSEKLGQGGKKIDVAVDPIEGTDLVAKGLDNAIAVISACEQGKMFDPGPSYYMEKLVVPSPAYGVVDLDAPVADNLKAIAKATGKNIQDLVIFVLNRPRHQKLIADIRKTGARIRMRSAGDVLGAISAASPRGDVDVLMGIGGTPEAVLSAVAVRAMQGQMLCRLTPQVPEEMRAVLEKNYDLKTILTEKDLIQSDDCWFSATGISGSSLLQGVEYSDDGHVTTHSISIRGKTGSIRFIETLMNLEQIDFSLNTPSKAEAKVEA